ncbi:MAG: YfaZ family outer membrane protein [Pelovirga sp.]
MIVRFRTFDRSLLKPVLAPVLALVLCLTATLAAADSFDIGFNDDSFHLGYERGMAQDEFGTVVGNLGFLHNDDKKTTFGRAGIDFIGSPGNYPGLNLGIGSRLYVGSTADSTDFINLAMGLRGFYAPPQLSGFGVGAAVYHSPKVFSFRDSERLTQSEVVLSYALVPKVRLTLGYYNTRLKEDRNNRDRRIDDSIRIGFTGYF